MTHPYRRLLGDRDIRTLWAGVTISSIGSELYLFGAIWIAVSIAGADGSLLATARFGTVLIMSVAAGAFVDLLPRRLLLIGADVVRAVFSLVIVAVAVADGLSLWLLVVVAIALSAAGTIYQPALQSGIPLLASDPSRLRETNGLIDATTRIAQAVGPFLAAALVAILPVIHLLTLNAISYLASTGAILQMGHRLEGNAPPVRQSFRKRLLRGLDAARSCPGTWTILATTGLRAGAMVLCCSVGIPLFFAQSPTGSVSAAAIVIGAAATWEILVNFVVAARPIASPWRLIFIGYASIGTGLALIGLAEATLSGWPLVAAMMLLALPIGFGNAAAGILMLTWFGIRMEPGDFSAVLRLRLLVVTGAATASTGLGAWIFDAFGIAATTFTGGALLLGAALFGVVLMEPSTGDAA